MEKRTKLICVAPGLKVTEFMKYNKSGLSIVQSSHHISDIKSLIGQYDIVIVPYEETIMKEMKKIDMNVLVIIPKVHRYIEIIGHFVEDMSPSLADLEKWKQNIFIPIANNMDFIVLDTGEFLTNSIDRVMKSPLGYNYPSNWLLTKRFMFDGTDLEVYGQNSDFKRLLLEITKYAGTLVYVSSDVVDSSSEDDGICLPNKVYVKRVTAEYYRREIELFKQLSENVIEINSRVLGCPKDENGLIDWKLVRQQLVIQHLLPKYQQ